MYVDKLQIILQWQFTHLGKLCIVPTTMRYWGHRHRGMQHTPDKIPSAHLFGKLVARFPSKSALGILQVQSLFLTDSYPSTK